VFGVTGIVLMILETELNMARVYDKVRVHSALSHDLMLVGGKNSLFLAA